MIARLTKFACRILGASVLLCIGLGPGLAFKTSASGYVREDVVVTINGVPEQWALEWEQAPSTICGPQDVALAITCPCAGWAYGELGQLSLIRRRGGREIERLKLAPLFGFFDYPDYDRAKGQAYLQRWPMQSDDFEREARKDPTLVQEIMSRKAPKVMALADYDRDGYATEFLIQVGTLPCKKTLFAAVGVSKRVPHLHALTSSESGEPIIIPHHGWDALLEGPGEHKVATWPCGDHGAEERTELILSAVDGEISGKYRSFTCPADGSPEKLTDESDL